MMMLRLNFVLTAFLVTNGCVSISTVHTAHPVVADKTEIGINAGTYGVKSEGEGITLPFFELQLRRGLSENIDIGAKLYPIGAGFDVNFMFLEGPVALSLDPSVSAFYFSTSSSSGDSSASGSLLLAYLTLPLLADVVHTDAFTLTLGGKIGAVIATASASASSGDAKDAVTDTGSQMTYGASAGAKFRISEGFAIMPAFDLLKYSQADLLLYQFNLGFLF